MFTGIIEEVGTIAQPGPHLKIICRTVLEDASPGASIAVNGTCLTIVQLDKDGFRADLSPETLSRTNLGALRTGSLVNLERPVAVGSRLSGHIVQGHVDGTAECVGLTALPDGNWWLQVRVPAPLGRYMIAKGSICMDGISLTIAALDGDVVSVAIIPHTYGQTNLKDRHSGDQMNLEVDMIAKYVEKLATIAT